MFTCGLVAVDGPPLSTFTMGVLVTPLLRGRRLRWQDKLFVVMVCIAGVAADAVGAPLIVAVRLTVFAAIGVAWRWHLAGRNCAAATCRNAISRTAAPESAATPTAMSHL